MFASAQQTATDALAAAFDEHCLASGVATATECRAASVAIGSSYGGNLGKRPAAMCAALGRCTATDNCARVTELDDGVSRPLDLCSATGLNGSAPVRADGESRLPEH